MQSEWIVASMILFLGQEPVIKETVPLLAAIAAPLCQPPSLRPASGRDRRKGTLEQGPKALRAMHAHGETGGGLWGNARVFANGSTRPPCAIATWKTCTYPVAAGLSQGAGPGLWSGNAPDVHLPSGEREVEDHTVPTLRPTKPWVTSACHQRPQKLTTVFAIFQDLRLPPGRNVKVGFALCCQRHDGEPPGRP